MVEDKNGCRAVKSFPDIAEVISDKSVDIKGFKHERLCKSSHAVFIKYRPKTK